MNLTKKCMLASLSISQWTAKKHDARITREIDQNHNAHDAGRYNKYLLAKSALEKSQQKVNECRTFWYQNTLPWNDAGQQRIVTTANYLEIANKIQKLKTGILECWEKFFMEYPAYIEDARARLNGLFDPADYPSVTKLRQKFAFSIDFFPLPDAADFRAELQETEANQIRQEIETRTKTATAEAMRDLYRRLYDVTRHMADRLGDPKAKFKNSLVQNIIELCQLLPRLNLTDDPRLDALRQEIETKLTQYTPDVLRDNETARKTTAQEAEAIMKKMEGIF